MRGVDIIQNCEVTAILRDGNRVIGVETTRGRITADKIGTAVAGHTSHVAEMAGLRMPIESHILQAMVSEPVKPCIDTVVTSGSGHMYISQSDKGELVFGGDLEFHNSYAQRGNFPRLEQVTQNVLTLFPAFSRLRLMRSWGGIMDMTMDGSPIISKTPLDNFYINGGWCYGGFKATPGSGWVYAHTIANDEPHELNAMFSLKRFETGHLIDEGGIGANPKAH
jgi:heterotetrameric sarcosine oxidase beta subunit